MEKEKVTYEFTKEEVQLLWEMIDVVLKATGLKSMVAMHSLAKTLQAPIIKEMKKK